MTTNDPISDMLTRIRNAAAVGKTDVEMPYSGLKHRVAEVLEKTGYVTSVAKLAGSPKNKDTKTKTGSAFDTLVIDLKYKKNQSAIRVIERVSKPGRRVYCKKDNLPIVLNGLGTAIISTPRGIMTNKEAKKEGLGGEVICNVY